MGPGFEGLTIDADKQILYAMLQSALIQDGGGDKTSSRYTRLVAYDVSDSSVRPPISTKAEQERKHDTHSFDLNSKHRQTLRALLHDPQKARVKTRSGVRHRLARRLERRLCYRLRPSPIIFCMPQSMLGGTNVVSSETATRERDENTREGEG